MGVSTTDFLCSQDDLEFLILVSLPPKFRSYRCVKSHLVYAWLGLEPGASDTKLAL